MKKKIAVAALSMLLAFGTTISAFASGSVAHGDLSVFKSGQLADKLSGQNPVDEGSLMVCDGKCMIKSAGISLVAADQAKFAIQNEESVFNLYVRSGQLNYVVNDNSRKIAFHTPSGSYSVAEVVFNAGSSPVVRGSVQVTDTGETGIAVTEGRLVFATADGMKTVDANHKIVLAAMVPPAAPVTPPPAPVTPPPAPVTPPPAPVIAMTPAAWGGVAALATVTVVGVKVSQDNTDDRLEALEASGPPSFQVAAPAPAPVAVGSLNQ